MTDAAKKALINKLGSKSSKAFDPLYFEDNRKWFVGKIVDSLLQASVADADVERKTSETIAGATKAMNDRIMKGFSTSGLKDQWKLYNKKKSRIQIIYGMVAINPQFLDAPNASYFDFILERRYRSIQRMAYYVNPNKVRNVFDYPDTSASPPEKMKVNKDSTSFWNGVTGGTLPFILSSLGKSDPTNADKNLFKTNKGSDRNLFACDPVATILHMDALLEARAPDQLLKALAGVGDHYLKIDNPLGHFANDPDGGQRFVGLSTQPITPGSHVDISMGRVGLVLAIIQANLTAAALQTNSDIAFRGPRFMIVQGDVAESFTIESVNPVTRQIKASSLAKSYAAGAKIFVTKNLLPFYGTLPYHFVTDSRTDHALFEQLTLKATDLQVGDHVYVINHPLYKIYYPTGAWGGEHSFITQIGNRDSASSAFRSELLVEGHGLNDTLLGMSSEMLEWNNTVLSILQSLTRIHLKYLSANGRKSTANVNFTTRLEPVDSTPQINVNVFEYKVPYTYTAFFNGKKKSITKSKGFVIKEQVANPDQALQVFNNDGTDSIVDKSHPPPDVFLAAVFTGSGPGEQFQISKWAAPYFNPQTAQFETQPLFESDNKTPKLLTFDDLAKSKPFFATDDAGDVYVTRPRVDFSPTYQAFLKSNGAI